MTAALDPRTTPFRPDLAATHLRGKVDAKRYADGVPHLVTASVAPVFAAPNKGTERVTEALFNEAVTVYEERGGWAWGQLASDAYVGYLPSATLGPEGAPATHRVTALRTFRYRKPDVKAPVSGWASLNAPVAVAAVEGTFARLANGDYVSVAHATSLDQTERDFVAVAERLVGTPYLWGGRTSFGLDCSALLQQSLAAAGIACPRDSDMIEREIGDAIDPRELAGTARRGDLVFWRGHCAIMVSDTQLVHANAHHMATVIEPAKEAIARIASHAGPVTGLRRMD